MNLLVSIRSEFLKTKRTASFYLTFFAAAFGPLMSLLDVLLDGIEAEHRGDILNQLMTSKFQVTGLVSFPIFLILICTLLPQIEYKSNAWKQVLASPQHKHQVYLAKFLNVQILILVFLLTNQLFMLADVVILHFIHPSLNVLDQPVDGYAMLMSRLNAYLALLAITSIQFWIGMRFRNFIIPIGIGIACWFAGSILVIQKLDFAAYFPYSYHAYGHFPKYDPLYNGTAWESLAFAVLFLSLGFFDFKTKRMG